VARVADPSASAPAVSAAASASTAPEVATVASSMPLPPTAAPASMPTGLVPRAFRALEEEWRQPVRRGELEAALADFAVVLNSAVSR
jgi:hypothetical protein